MAPRGRLAQVVTFGTSRSRIWNTYEDNFNEVIVTIDKFVDENQLHNYPSMQWEVLLVEKAVLKCTGLKGCVLKEPAFAGLRWVKVPVACNQVIGRVVVWSLKASVKSPAFLWTLLYTVKLAASFLYSLCFTLSHWINKTDRFWWEGVEAARKAGPGLGSFTHFSMQTPLSEGTRSLTEFWF